jgi:ribosomal protein S27AE
MSDESELQEVKTFRCPRCGGKGEVYNHERGGSPYEPIGFSKARLRQVLSAYDSCPRCDGKGIILVNVPPATPKCSELDET